MKCVNFSCSLQVRELQQQVGDQLQGSNGSSACQPSVREEQLKHVIQQLQAQLRNTRDIHCVSNPLLDTDKGLQTERPGLSTTGMFTVGDSEHVSC
jgi:hypothetical protein